MKTTIELGPTDAALIYENGEYRFVLPDMDGDTEMPRLMALLGAVFIRSQRDEGWIDAMIDDMLTEMRREPEPSEH